MSTTVADLVATLRADVSGFTSGMQSAASSTDQLGTSASGSSSGLSALDAGLTAVAAVATDAFVNGITSAINVTNQFDQMVQASTISFEGLGNSIAKAQQMTQQGIKLGIQLGVDPQQLEKSQQILIGLVGSYANTADNLTKLEGAAVTAQQPLASVTVQVARLANIMANNPSSGLWYGMSLASQNIESFAAVTKAQTAAKTGGSEQQVFADLMQGLHGSTQAAQQYADTLSGATSSLKTLGQAAIAEAFTPIYDAEIKAAEALRQWLSTSQGQNFIAELQKAIQGLLPDFDTMISKGEKFLESLSPQKIDNFISSLKEMAPLMTTILGIGTGNPVMALGGLLSGTSEGRKALEEIAGSLAKLVMSIGQALPAIGALAGAIAEPLAILAQLAALVIDVAASFKPFDDAIAMAIGLWAGFKVWEGVTTIFSTVTNAVRGTGAALGAQTAAMADKVPGTTAMTQADSAAAEAQQMMARATQQNVEALTGAVTALKEYRDQLMAIVEAETQATEVTDSSASAYENLYEARISLIKVNADLRASELALAEAQGVAADAAVTETTATRGLSGMGMAGAGVGGLLGLGMMAQGAGQGGAGGWISSIMGGAMTGGALASIVPGLGTVAGLIGGGAIGGLSHLLLGGMGGGHGKPAVPNADLANLQALNPTYSSTGNSALLDNLTAMKDRANAAGEAVTNLTSKQAELQGQLAGLTLNGPGTGTMGPTAYAPGAGDVAAQLKQTTTDLAAVSGEFKSSTQAVDNFETSVSRVAKVTGASSEQVIAAAKAMQINLAGINPNTTAGVNALQDLVSALTDTSSAMNSTQQSATAFASEIGDWVNIMSGKTGAKTFSISGGQVAQMQAMNKNLAGEGYNTAQLQFDTSEIAQQQGKTEGTSQALQHELTLMQQHQKWIDLNHQLVDASHNVTKALQDEANATFDLNNAELDVVKAHNDLLNAEFSLTQARLKDTEAIITQQDASEIMRDALKGFTDQYVDLNANLNQLLPSQRALGEEIVSEANHLQTLEDTYTRINNRYTLMNDSLQTLTDTMKMYQDVANAPLQGQYGQQDAIQQNKMAQDQLQMQINQAELEGANTQSLQIINLENQLDVLKKIGDQLQLQYDTSIGNQQFQIQQAENSQLVVTFQQAMAAASQVGKLNTEISGQTRNLDSLKPALDKAKASLDAYQEKVLPLIAALKNEESANQGVIDGNHSVVTSIQAVNNASIAVTNAYHAVALAQVAVRNATYAYDDAIFQQQSIYAQMKQQTVQDNLTMSQSIQQYVSDYQAALGQLEQTQKGAMSQTQQLLNMMQQLMAMSNLQGSMNTFGTALYNLAGGQGSIPLPGGGTYTTGQLPPGMATGGLATQPTMVAEDGLPELVLPLTNIPRSLTLLQMYAPKLLPNLGTSGGTPISSIGGSGKTIMIQAGAVQVAVSGVPGSGAAINEIETAIEGALRQIVQQW